MDNDELLALERSFKLGKIKNAIIVAMMVTGLITYIYVMFEGMIEVQDFVSVVIKSLRR